MLRRKPTALAVTGEDIAPFEEKVLRLLAYDRYLTTGEDPDGLFRNNNDDEDDANGGHDPDGTTSDGGGDAAGTKKKAGVKEHNPSDELKPLPGDKARIVRSREERIMGGGGGSGGAGAR
ncbi:uncharacterized protein Z519_01229 [Cladophialophora bantiana CBS 173.52]|uniref:Uncharacterized protein n=1 Tax=Cladophialophora bantiana (strain ATCC 10958 / CBS 173.52 / CDC B-1940 / NIH 8579) TaxID=1442370 RepID=A0A0D2I376_CLAB1|nr:uncharacterized protein Z519_01229 [Cladophialophora bantiana CBS 173.52]KIW97645.1 hypothetical protein Z519_01229 [Cladophialophora bantiana CBS 173.52]